LSCSPASPWRHRASGLVIRDPCAPCKGCVGPVGGRYPTRQLLLQPEVIGAWALGNEGTRSPRWKRSPWGINEHVDHNENEHRASLEKDNVNAESVRIDEGRGLAVKRATQAAAGGTGVWVMGCGQRNDVATRESRCGGEKRPQLQIREDRSRLQRETERSVVAQKRVMIVERRDLSSRATRQVARAGRLM
jgi:hypothetical protein